MDIEHELRAMDACCWAVLMMLMLGLFSVTSLPL